MLSKLLKYDFKSGSQIILTIIISMAVFLGLSLILMTFNNGILNSLIIIVSLFATIALFATFAIVRILYFYNTMTKNESYFTFTIPSKVNNIVFSKIFTSLIWGLICIAFLMFYWAILLNSNGNLTGLLDILKQLVPFTIASISTQFIFVAMLMAFSISLSVYAKLKKNNYNGVVISVIAYIIFYYVCGIVQIAVLALTLAIQGNLGKILSNEITDANAMQILNSSTIPIALVYLISGLLFYFLTVKIFSKYKSI
ncbi:MAG: hypothetical protein FWC47_08520 [Oscillospiraceae bacterium]|nr:hypothetical protein [Oscillospiraceae bacterium]